jgi:hypothetical protein
MHTEGSLIECKTVLPGKRQITIKEDDLKALSYRAAIQDRRPELHVELGSNPPQRWILLPEGEYKEVVPE